MKSKDIQIAEKIVKQYGEEYFVSNLASSDLFVINKKKGPFSKIKKMYVIVSDKCAHQIILRYKLYNYKKLFENKNINIIYNDKSLTYILSSNVFNYIQKCYNAKYDNDFFDIKIQKFVDILDDIVSINGKISDIVCVSSDEEKTVKLLKLCTEIKKYHSGQLDDEIIL